MSKFKFASHSDRLAEAKTAMEAADEDKKMDIMHSTALMLNVDLSKTGCRTLVETEAYKKWLAANKEKNPFIGSKYTERAPEYESDSETIKESEAVEDNEAAKLLEKGEDGLMHLREDLEPNASEDNDEPLTGAAAKFVDLCVINNVVSTRLGWEFDKVMDDVISALNEYHENDLDFELPPEEDLKKQVQMSIDAAEYKYQLSYNKKVAEQAAREQEKKNEIKA